MTRLACGYHEYTGGTVTLPTPTTPDPVPGFVPPDPGPQGARYMVAVGPFPDAPNPANLTVLWDARIENLSIRSREAGGNTVTISVPATPENMRLLGTPIAGTSLFHSKKAISKELVVGSTSDGKARWRFVIRDPWVHEGNRVTITGVGIVGGLDADVVIGAPTRKNLLKTTNTSWETGTFSGWNAYGDVEYQVVAGGVDGGYKLRVRGTPDAAHNYVAARARRRQPYRPWGRQTIAAQAYVQLPPYGIDIEDFGLVSVAIFDADTGAEYWPGGNEDKDAGIVTNDMRRGSFNFDPVVALGYLPSPPYAVDIWIRLYPTDPVQWTYYDAATLFSRENTSTTNEVDVTRMMGELWDHANTGRTKKDKGVTVSYGEPAGIDGVWTVWHDDGTPLPEATESFCARGFEVWDYPTGKREVRAAKRRGAVRSDVQVNPWDVLGAIRWQIDPGAQRTSLRVSSAAGSIWGGADVGSIDGRRANGQIIDVTMSGPAGMTPSALQAYADQRLATLSVLPGTATLFVPWELGQRLQVGDTVHAALIAGSAGHSDWVRIYGWDPDLDGRRWVAVDVGTDTELGTA